MEPNHSPEKDVKRLPLISVRSAINLCLFVGALNICNYVLEQAYPNIFPRQIQRKFDHYREHKDEYDVVFVGSSLIHRQVIPKVFDRELRRRGHKIRSFNFGVPHMRFHETNMLIERLLASKSDRLKWIFVDAGAEDRLLDDRNWFSHRVIRWHTPSETWFVLEDILELDEPVGVKAKFMFGHLEHMGMQLLHIGQGPRIVRELGIIGDPNKERKRGKIKNEGFLSLDDALRAQKKAFRKRRAEMLRQKDVYEDMVDRVKQWTDEEAEAKESYKRRILDQAITIRKAGVEPIYLVTPIVRGNPKMKQLAAESDLITLFAYNNPERYPRFYDPVFRFDFNHLSEAGSRIFTRLLAKDFARHLKDPA